MLVKYGTNGLGTYYVGMLVSTLLFNFLDDASINMNVIVILNQAKQSNRRISYAQLLKDHLILVQLFKMTDVTFAIPLMSYYMMNVLSRQTS